MLKALLKGLFKLLFRIEIQGADPAKFANERTLVIANHTSFLDGLLLTLFLPGKATFLVHTEVTRKPLSRFFLRFIPHYAIDTTNPLGIRAATKLIHAGEPVVIFPEGRLTVTGSLMKVYDGAAFLAAKTDATIVPVRIEGTGLTYFARLAGLYPRKLFPKMKLSILATTKIPMPEGDTAKLRRRRAGVAMRDLLMSNMVDTRERSTLYQSYLGAMNTFGRDHLVAEDVRWVEDTYGTFLKQMLGLGRWVETATTPGETVGIYLANATPTVALIHGTCLRGRIASPLNFSSGVADLRANCVTAGIKHIFTSRTFLERGKLTGVLEQLEGVKIHYLEDARTSLSLADKLWVLYRMRFPRGAEARNRPQDPAVVLFTSGSEGKPKGVVHTHDSLLSNVSQVRAMADFMPTDKFFISLPLFHSFGMLSGALLPFVVGCRVFYYPSPLHFRQIPELVYDRNCTVLFGTPTFLSKYAKDSAAYNFARLRYVVAGAEKLSEQVRKQWIDDFGIRILEGFGTSETGPVISVNTPMAARPNTVGRAVPGLQLRLEPVPGITEGGRLFVKGPNVMAGYLRHENPTVLEPTGTGNELGWHDTGDVVTIDQDGFIRIQDRASRFAKIGGEMVSLEVAESVARLVSNGAQATVKRPDATKGEAIVLFTTDATLTRDQLQSAARSLGVAELAVPRDIRRLDAIPLLGTGKTDYAALARMAAA